MKPFERDLRKWHERLLDVEKRIELISEAIGLEVESPLRESVWALCGAYTEALETKYDLIGWLEWWWHECHLGEKPQQARLEGEALRVIKTIDDLISIISDDLKKAQ